MKKTKRKYPSYKYIKAHSLLKGLSDEYQLTEEEYGLLYEFFVTYSLCNGQSAKRRKFADYGWEKSITKSGLKTELKKILELDKNPNFVFLDDKDKTSKKVALKFKSVGLEDGAKFDFDYEHGVVGRTKADNHYLMLFYRIRDGLAHGKYILKMSSMNERMFVVQDDGNSAVSARIIIKIDTLLCIIKTIDKNKILQFNSEKVEGKSNGKTN